MDSVSENVHIVKQSNMAYKTETPVLFEPLFHLHKSFKTIPFWTTNSSNQ